MLTQKHHIAMRNRLKIYRVEHGCSLSKMSKLLGISSSLLGKYEQNDIEISMNIYMRLNRFFKLENQSFSDDFFEFHELAQKLIRVLYYLDYKMAKETMNLMMSKEPYYQASIYFLEYELLKATYEMLTNEGIVKLSESSKKLEIAKNSYETMYKDLHDLLQGRYAMMCYEIFKAKYYFERHLSYATQEGFIAMNYFYQGILNAFSYKTYRKAFENFKVAKNHFQTQNNFVRIMDLHIIEQRLCIYTNDYYRFDELNKQTLHYGEMMNNAYIKDYSLQQKALYYIALGDFENAFELFNRFHINTIEYQFHKVYTLYRLGHYIEAKHLMKVHFEYAYDSASDAVHKGYQAMLELMNLDDPEKILTKLKAFADSAYDSEVYPLIKIAFKLYLKHLEQHRKYKEAYYYSKKVLEVTEYVLK